MTDAPLLMPMLPHFWTATSSRERNRIHARRTRQRKKHQMEILRERADVLKDEQIRLKQAINDKNTANILLGLFSQDLTSESSGAEDDAQVDALMRRPSDQIPDSTCIGELPRLILPGQHTSSRMAEARDKIPTDDVDIAEGGIDFDLLGKDRSKCTAEELDQIRRERNRMHAKRTRDRKRLFLEEMSEVCRQLEEENGTLRCHLRKIDPDGVSSVPEPPKITADFPSLEELPASKRIKTSALASGGKDTHRNTESLAPLVSLNPSLSLRGLPSGENKMVLSAIAPLSRPTSDQLQFLIQAAASCADLDPSTESFCRSSASSSPNIVSVNCASSSQVDTDDNSTVDHGRGRPNSLQRVSSLQLGNTRQMHDAHDVSASSEHGSFLGCVGSSQLNARNYHGNRCRLASGEDERGIPYSITTSSVSPADATAVVGL
jgi:Basic region leucine zipper